MDDTRTREILELISRNLLLDELARRFDTVVFGGYRHNGDGSGDHMLWYAGHPFIALGLTEALGHEIHEETQNTRQPEQEEEGR